jgi:hypothetical protein
VVINEVAWAGTTANAADEWFELYNAGESAVDLTGWGLYEVGAEGDVRVIALQGTIAAGGYYLVERSDDTSISDILADLAGSFGGSGFNNAGESLKLKDGGGVIVDSIPCSTGWFAGDNAAKSTMERINPLLPGTDSGNWATHGDPDFGSDSGTPPNRIEGSPRERNSVTAP